MAARIWAGRRFATWSALCLLWLPGLSGGVRAQTDDSCPDAFPVEKIDITTVEQLDSVIPARAKLQQQLRDLEVHLTPDPSGRKFTQYMDEFVFTEDARQRLLSFRDAAAAEQQKGDSAAMRSTLRQASDFLTAQLWQVSMLGWYFSRLEVIPDHEAALKTVLDKSPAEEGARTRARIDALRAQLPAGVERAVRAPAPPRDSMTARDIPEILALFKGYNEERMRLAPFATQYDVANGVAPMSRSRTDECTGPAPSISGRATPSIDQSHVELPVFPVSARRRSFEGSVIIMAHVSPSGCPEHVQIARTNGVESLDASALVWAEGQRFHPAERDGKPVAADYTFSVTFRLTE